MVIARTISFACRALIVFSVLVVLLCYFGFNLILSRYQNDIESALSEATGTAVHFGSVAGRFLPDLAIAVDNFQMQSDDPRCSLNVSAKDVKFSLALLPLISRRFIVNAVYIEDLNTSSIEEYRRCKDLLSVPVDQSQKIQPAVDNKNHSVVEIHIDDFALNQAQVALGTKKLYIDNLQASFFHEKSLFELRKAVGTAKIDETQFDFNAELIQLQTLLKLDKFKFTFPESNTQAELNGTYDDGTGQWQLRIDRMNSTLLYKVVSLFTRISVSSLPKADISANIAISHSTQGAVMINSDLTLDRPSFDIDGNLFEAASASAQLNTQAVSGKVSIKGNASFKDFQYKNDTVKLNDKNARLDSLNFSLDAKNVVQLTIKLLLSSPKLHSPHVSGVGNSELSAPLIVQVQNGGRYSVAGPIFLQGVALDIKSKKIQELQGKLDFNLDQEKLTIAGSHLGFTERGKPASLNIKYQMDHKNHTLTQTNLASGWGTFVVSGSITRDSRKQYSLESDIKGVKLAEFGDAFNIEDLRTSSIGLDSATLILNGRISDGRKSMTGRSKFTFNAPSNSSYNLTRRLQRALSVLPGVSSPKSDNPVFTQYISGQLQIQNGVVSTDNITVQNDRYSLNLNGSIALDNTIDGSGSVSFFKESAEMFGFGIPLLSKLVGRIGTVVIPLSISGTFPSPSYEVDLATLLKDNSGLALIDQATTVTKSVAQDAISILSSPLRSVGIISRETPLASPSASPRAKP